MFASPGWSSLDEEEQEEEEEEPGNSCGDVRWQICKAICFLLWIIPVVWSIFVVVPTVKFMIQVSELSPEAEFVKSDGGCLILDAQHGSSGECVTRHHGNGGKNDWTSDECLCEDVFTYSFKDTEGSKLTSSQDVKTAYSSSNPCYDPVWSLTRITTPPDADAHCASTCATNKQASTYNIGDKVTCWTPKVTQATLSRTVGTEKNPYTCANAKCVKIFDPAVELRDLQLSHWNSGPNVFAIVILVLCVGCPVLLSFQALISWGFEKLRGGSDDDDDVERPNRVSRPERRRQ